eukprot:SAG11_NODE_10144_length_851_cov_56.453457_1_plen_215_part_10
MQEGKKRNPRTSSRLSSAADDQSQQTPPPRSGSKAAPAPDPLGDAQLVAEVADKVSASLADVVSAQVAAALAAAGLPAATAPVAAVAPAPSPAAGSGHPDHTPAPAVLGHPPPAQGQATVATGQAAALAGPPARPLGFGTPPRLGRDPIPHLDLAWATPGRIARQQERGLTVPTNLLSVDEKEKLVPGYSLLSKGQQAELAYRLACDKRLDDVLS